MHVCLLPLPLDCGICMDIQTRFGVAPSHPTTYQNLPAPRIFCFFGSPKGNRKRWQNCGCSSTTLTGAHVFPKTSMEETNWEPQQYDIRCAMTENMYIYIYTSRVRFIYSDGKVISHFCYRFHNVHHYLQYCRSYRQVLHGFGTCLLGFIPRTLEPHGITERCG